MTQALFPFQEESVELFQNVPTALLGDDMGLGKTVQAIALDKRKRELHQQAFQTQYKGKAMTLVISPLSTLGGWAWHFKEWQPNLKVVQIDPKDRGAFVNAFKSGNGDVFLCHWESLRLMPELKSIMWFHVIGDEIHRIKNRKAQMSVELKQVPTAHKLGMSGTPADNRPDDFWNVLNWLFPKMFPSYWAFFNHHVIHIHHQDGTMCCEKRHKRPFKEVIGTHDAESIHRVIKGRYIRRLKEEVAKDLPEKYYTTIEVDLAPQQRRAYEQMRLHMLAWIGENEDNIVAAPVVIAQLTRLQQFACAYGEIQKVTSYTRRGCQAILVTESPESDPNAEPYEHWRLALPNEVADDEANHSKPNSDGCCIRCKKYILSEADKLVLTDPSTKLDAVMELIEDNPEESFVVFGQSKQVANLLAARLASKNITYALLTGDTKSDDRTKIIDDFQNGKRRVFVGTIAAGGTGITLTRAYTCVFIDHAWSPSANRQAEDRLHRIGQKNAVQIIRIIARDTIDAERLERIELKWEWLREILGDKKVKA